MIIRELIKHSNHVAINFSMFSWPEAEGNHFHHLLEL